MHHPLVTIAIPTYNRADTYFQTALDSALQQSYGRVDVLVSDNSTNDATSDLIEEDYANDERLRYVHHEENLGAIGNFNYCLNAARGEFFLLLHDDDCIDLDLIETCVNGLHSPSGVGYVRTGVRLIDQQGNVTEQHPNEAFGSQGAQAVLEWMRFKNFWTLSSTLYETEALRAVGGFDHDTFRLTCDCYATATIAIQTGGGVELRPVKASFRVHEGELGHQVSPLGWIDEWARLYRHSMHIAPSPEVREHFRKEGAEFFSHLCYNYAMRVPSLTGRLRAYTSVYSKFGGRYLPPPLRKQLRSIKNFFLP